MHRGITKQIITKLERIKRTQRFKILNLKISVMVFFSLFLFDITFVVVLALFSYHFLRCSIYFFFIIYEILLLFFVDFIIFMFMFKKRIISIIILCFMEDYRRLQLLRSMFGHLPRSNLCISSFFWFIVFMILTSLFKGYHVVWVVLPLICINYKK